MCGRGWRGSGWGCDRAAREGAPGSTLAGRAGCRGLCGERGVVGVAPFRAAVERADVGGVEGRGCAAGHEAETINKVWVGEIGNAEGDGVGPAAAEIVLGLLEGESGVGDDDTLEERAEE